MLAGMHAVSRKRGKKGNLMTKNKQRVSSFRGEKERKNLAIFLERGKSFQREDEKKDENISLAEELMKGVLFEVMFFYLFLRLLEEVTEE